MKEMYYYDIYEYGVEVLLKLFRLSLIRDLHKNRQRFPYYIVGANALSMHLVLTPLITVILSALYSFNCSYFKNMFLLTVDMISAVVNYNCNYVVNKILPCTIYIMHHRTYST